MGKNFIKAAKAILPVGTQIFAVGGVDQSNIVEWRQAGADGFGLGSCLYKPAQASSLVRNQAQSLIETFKKGR